MSQARQGGHAPTEWTHMGRQSGRSALRPAPRREPALQTPGNRSALPCPAPSQGIEACCGRKPLAPPAPPRDRQLAVPKTSRGGGRAVTREEVMSTTSVRSNLAWEHWSHRKLSGRTPLRKMPLAAEGRKGWRELSRRPAAQVGVTANPGRDGEPQTRAVYRDWRRQTEGQRGKAQGRYYLVYTEESEAEFK